MIKCSDAIEQDSQDSRILQDSQILNALISSWHFSKGSRTGTKSAADQMLQRYQ